MVSKKDDKNSFTQREIGVAINNAIALAKSPNKTGSLEQRFPKLQEYAIALFQPLQQEIKDEFLRPEEAVLICLCGALFHQMRDVMQTEKLPMGELVNALLVEK